MMKKLIHFITSWLLFMHVKNVAPKNFLQKIFVNKIIVITFRIV